MHDIFDPIRSFLAIETISIDNVIFRIHYKATVFILAAFSLLLTQKQYFGDPIDCQVGKGFSVDGNLIDTYCWIFSTYTLPYKKGTLYSGIHTPTPESEVKHHAYYQWVTLFLILQAIMFYVPRYIWIAWEGGKIEMLVKNLQYPLIEGEEKDKRKRTLLNYFRGNAHGHTFYTMGYLTCELLNLVNIIGQIFLVDYFIGFEFLTYGQKGFADTEKEFGDRIDALDVVFPKVTKCNYNFGGVGGGINKVDALCILPLNVFNEKVFLIMWLWFMIVICLTCLGMVFRVLTFSKTGRRILLQMRTRIARPEDVHKINAWSNYGDWFLLYMIAGNIEPFTLKEFFKEFAAILPEVKHI